MWKLANVTPISRKGCKLLIKHYRPPPPPHPLPVYLVGESNDSIFKKTY